MIPVSGFEGRQVAVFGLGASGIASARALIAGDSLPLCWDDAESARNNAAKAGLSVSDLRVANWGAFAALILTPGVPLTHPAPHPIVLLAQAANVPILGDVELFSRERKRRAPKSPLVAVTGTNGKSTTVALIAHLLREAGRDVALGGNFGPPVLSLSPPASGRFHVLECSSYQIELAPSLAPSVGILLNISTDHLDRHGTIERYAEIKAHLPQAADHPVVCVDDPRSALIADHIEQMGRRVTRVSVRNPLADGVVARNGVISAVAGGAQTVIADISAIRTLRGAHNAQNAAAAVAAVLELGLRPAEIAPGLSSFAGLAHRMEEVGRIGRILFVNDSKATNADATSRALASFNDIYWIVGGRPKSDGIAGLEPLFPRVAKAFLIGESAAEFARTMEGKLTYELSETLERAVADAIGVAILSKSSEPVVLLSPAAASFDQFKNFAERGETFRNLVKKHEAKAGGAS
jgi:UDP-N-acetylmuramoylalanine--D-glutamate ligase